MSPLKENPHAFGPCESCISNDPSGAGNGLSVITNSGQAAWGPCESAFTSKLTVPVLPAKSNGCFGYIARTVYEPSLTAVCSSTDSTSWPLQILTSFGGKTVFPH